MKSISNFIEGMNSDISRIYQSNKQYIKAVNFRPVTVLGSSNGALTNIVGNNCEITFPSVHPVYKLKIKQNGSGTFSITINNVTSNTINVTDNTSIDVFYNEIKSLSNCYDGVYGSNKNFSIALLDDSIYIYQQTEYIGCSSNNAVDPVIGITATGTTLYFIDKTNNEFANQTFYVSGNYIHDKLVVIGSTNINKTIYLYTCPENNINKTGQIWELVYSELTGLSTLKLIYNNYLNFSIDHTIPPTASIGRYELPSLQRIIFSDFYNPVRSINVKSDNLMAFEPSEFTLIPSLELSIPTLHNITDNDVVNPFNTNQTIQIAYRLTKSNGAITAYSPLSDMVYPTKYDIGQYIGSFPNFSSLDGETGNSNKSFTFRVSGIDTTYDFIEFVVIIKNTTNGVKIYKYETQSVGSNNTLLSTFKNDSDNFEEITVSEFNIDNLFFTHAKTIEQKNNRLFFANVKNDLTEYLETFDTRAYRFDTSSDNIKIKVNTNDSTCTIRDISTLDYPTNDDDLVPSINLGMSTADDSEYDGLYKYQRNSTIVGGTGPNISFKFGALALKTDTRIVNGNPNSFSGINEGTERDGSTCDNRNGFRIPGSGNGANPLIDTFYRSSSEQEGHVQNYKHSIGLEYFNGNFKGYQQNEIYRIGIQFYSKNGSTFFTKWIGDIKFPNYNDFVAPGFEAKTDSGTLIPDFRSCFFEGTNTYSIVPYLVVDVNITKELASFISGYEIVRVERTEDDKTIAAQGLINQTQVSSTSGQLFLPISSHTRTGGSQLLSPSNDITNPSNTFGLNTIAKAHPHEITFHNFEYLVNQGNYFTNKDKLIIVEKYGQVNQALIWAKSTTIPAYSPNLIRANLKHFISKFYDLKSFFYDNTAPSDIYEINGGNYVGQNDVVTTANGNTYTNRDWVQNLPGFISPNLNKGWAKGSHTNIISLKTSNIINWQSYNGGSSNVCDINTSQANSKLLALHYKPTRLFNQYGGKSVIARANSEYISCGAFYKVTDDGLSTIQVFGGDMYNSILDIQKAIKQDDGNKAIEGVDITHSQVWFFPHQSCYNIDMRTGLKANSDLNNLSASNALTTDEYGYNAIYSLSNDLRKFLPKPLNFNSTNDYFNMIYWSEVKINGESNDSWSSIPVNNNYSLDGNHGGITALITLNNYVYAIQEKAISLLYIDPNAMINTTDNQPVRIGYGDTLSKHNYLSVDIGSTHQWSINKSPNHITFVDTRHKKLYLFNGESLNCISDVKGLKGFLNKTLVDNILVYDNPIKYTGIHCTYDYLNNEFVYTFLNTSERYTVVFNELTNSFTSFYSFTPYIYLNNGINYYSLNDYNVTNKIWMHNKGNYCEFYGTVYSSSIKVNVNPEPMFTKTFDNLSWITEAQLIDVDNQDDINNRISEEGKIPQLDNTFNRVRCYNEYQNSDWITLDYTPKTGNLRRVEQTWNLQVPRSKVNYDTDSINIKSIFDPTILTKTSFGQRLRDKYMIVDLEYNNTSNNMLILQSIISDFRLSNR